MTAAAQAQPHVYIYGAHEVAESDIHPASQRALIRRGLAHVLGNEAASKVVAKAEAHRNSALAAWLEGKPADAKPSDEVLASFEPSDEAQAKWKAEAQATFLTSIREGTLGVSAVRGPKASVDPLERAMQAIARSRVETILANQGIKPGVYRKADWALTMASGKFTMAELVSRQIAKDTAGIRKEAERVLAEAARKAKKVAEAAAEGGAEALL